MKILNGSIPIIDKHIKKEGRLGSGTEYVIALLPLGGYVKMAGMIDENMDHQIQHEDDEFMSQPLWGKIWILSAGVIMNTILAFFIFGSLGYYQGTADIVDEPIVRETIAEYPAELAGIISGDRIIKLDGYNEKDKIHIVEKYLLPEADTSMVPPLPTQEMPNPEIVQTPPPVTQTGLTMAEQALLSEEEKMMTLRNRGMV